MLVDGSRDYFPYFAVQSRFDDTGARTFGEQLRRIVCDTPFEYEGDSFTVTVSVGITTVEGSVLGDEDLSGVGGYPFPPVRGTGFLA